MNSTRMRQLGMKQHESNEPEVQTTVLAIAGMSCGACARHVTRALDGMTGVVHVSVDLRTNEASVEHLPAFVDAASLIAAVRGAGYGARVARTVDDADTTTGAEPKTAACGCGCCGSVSKTAAGSWSNLGTSTIG
jgi:copper chaperone CopZ